MLSVDALSARLGRHALLLLAGSCRGRVRRGDRPERSRQEHPARPHRRLRDLRSRVVSSIEHRDVTGLEPALRPVSIVFQEHNLFPHLDVAANVGLGLHPALRLKLEDHDEIDRALEGVGLAGLHRQAPGPALRRPAAAGGTRSRPGAPPPRAPPRRALRRARAGVAPRDAGAAWPAPVRPWPRCIDGEPPPRRCASHRRAHRLRSRGAHPGAGRDGLRPRRLTLAGASRLSRRRPGLSRNSAARPRALAAAALVHVLAAASRSGPLNRGLFGPGGRPASRCRGRGSRARRPNSSR